MTGPSPSSKAPARVGFTTVRLGRHGSEARPNEDGGGCDLRGEEPGLQPPLPSDVWPLSRGPGRLHPGFGLGRASVSPSVRDRWRGGQVESHVGTVRQRFFSPRLRVKSFEELNALLIDKCIAWAKANPHPEMTDRTVWEVFEAERPQLVPYAGRFDGFHSVPAAVSKTCLVRFDSDEDQELIRGINSLRNKYSVMASAVGRPVEIRAYAERIEIRQDGRLVGDHPRCFGRGRTIYDPWHYVPVLVRKPGALRSEP